MDTLRLTRARYPSGDAASILTVHFECTDDYLTIIFDGPLDTESRDARTVDEAIDTHRRMWRWVKDPDHDPFPAKYIIFDSPAPRRSWWRRLWRRNG